MEWSNELIMEFLELYEAEPCIWNPRHPDHKLRNVVHDAWAKIVKKLEIDCTMAELKKKKDGLMATYRKLAHKVRNTEKSATGEVYKPEWFAYDFMNKFLNGVYRPHVYYQYWEDTPEENNRPKISWRKEEKKEDRREEKPPYEVPSIETVYLEMPSTSAEDNESSSKSQKSSRKKRKRKSQAKEIENPMEEVAVVAPAAVPASAPKVLQPSVEIEKDGADECVLYATLLVKKLRALDESTRGVAMLQIDQIMHNLRYNNGVQTPSIGQQAYFSPVPINYQNNFTTPTYTLTGIQPQFQPVQTPNMTPSKPTQPVTTVTENPILVNLNAAPSRESDSHSLSSCDSDSFS